MASETLDNVRNFGKEIRNATSNKAEQGKLLREMVGMAGGIDEDAARRVLDAFRDAELAIVPEESWQEGVRSSDSLQRLGALAERLLPKN